MASDSDEGGDTSLLLTLLPNDKQEEEGTAIADSSTRHHLQNQRHHLRSINATLVTRQLPSRGLSFQLWPAASTLLSLLDNSPSSLRLPPPPIRILELGSGTGLAGIAAAAALGAHVTLTDLPHVIPNLRFNADANSTLVTARGGSLAVRQLTWGNKGDLFASEFDVVMGSDLVYFDHLFDPLLETLGWFVKGEVGFVMAHLRRWKKKDSVFFRKARKMFDVEVLFMDEPMAGSRVGVVVYRFTAKKKKESNDGRRYWSGGDRNRDVIYF